MIDIFDPHFHRELAMTYVQHNEKVPIPASNQTLGPSF